MNISTMNNVMQDARRDWRSISPKNLKAIRTMLIIKHNSLTQAAKTLGVLYPRLSNTINGREQTVYAVEAIQNDLELSDNQVLNLWPLLKSWPRESRRVG
jgi:hypothetical protein